jgi:hypothetical protein
MGATFSRIKTWIAEVLTAADLNAEFNNILNNLTPTGIDDASANETAMQATADPYPGSVASLATSLAGELHRLRYLIRQITKKTYWYEDPDTLQFYTGYWTHDISVTGDQAITGVGFTGNLLILMCIIAGGIQASWGYKAGTTAEQMIVTPQDASAHATWAGASNYIGYFMITSTTDFARLTFKSWDADGFTMTWSKNGSPTGTATGFYLVIKLP